MNDLGDRMKDYENSSKIYLTKNVPVILRVDGVSFHSFTKNFNRPFDQLIMDSMVNTTIAISKRIQGFKCAYTQSDEVSILITDYDTIETCGWFNYNKSKLESVTAGLMSAYFQNDKFKQFTNITPYFDCRAFNVPKEDVVNYFLWRAKDWERNSLSMYCSSFFSAKQLHGKNREGQHEMLFSINKNWTNDLDKQQKNGTMIFVDRIDCSVLPKYDSIKSAIYNLVHCDSKDN
jgi:tRNA(His) guanylyltransferase